jgi:hypothetical protein
MSALGHKRTFAAQKGMSALPPKADMCGAKRNIRFVPIADIATRPNDARSKTKCVLLDDWLRVVRHYQPATTDPLIDPGYKEIDRLSGSILHFRLTDLLPNLPGEIAIDVNMRFAQRGLSLQEQLVGIVRCRISRSPSTRSRKYVPKSAAWPQPI